MNINLRFYFINIRSDERDDVRLTCSRGLDEAREQGEEGISSEKESDNGGKPQGGESEQNPPGEWRRVVWLEWLERIEKSQSK